MIVGVHQTSKLGNKKKVVTAFCSTTSQNFVETSSKSYVSDKSVLPVVDKMDTIIGDALLAYMECNKGVFPK